MIARFLIISIFVSGMFNLQAQNKFIPLWSNVEIPNYKESSGDLIKEFSDIILISNVQIPGMDVFLPAKNNANGQAVIICPGGGYVVEAYDWEGTDIAMWLASNGIAAFVLQYRLPLSGNSLIPHLSPMLDAQRAIRLVRFNAFKWNINPFQIGIMGFSAGGHLASTVGTHFDYGIASSSDPVNKMSSRPDFMVLVYPVITFTQEFMHKGSRDALLGNAPSEELIKNFSNELQVTQKTPPTLLIHAADDAVVPPQNSIVFFQALQEKKVSCALHIFPKGGHGFSLAHANPLLHKWTNVAIDWINDQKDEQGIKESPKYKNEAE